MGQNADQIQTRFDFYSTRFQLFFSAFDSRSRRTVETDPTFMRLMCRKKSQARVENV